ncbi:MAG: ATP-binding protein [Parachlamydiaceae bacterium]|nr:ATP-binding protein [Parachlamydiaceae bacterium]
MLRTLITEFHERDLPKVISRAILFPKFPPEVRKAHVLMGMRRTGKTWILFQHMQSLLEEGIKKENLLYINFEDDRFENFRASHFQLILDAYFDLYPLHGKSKDLFFFFDEIHLIPGWEKFIRRLLDQEKMEIFVTGSSAHMLSKEISTTLHGRAWGQEVFPCSFLEYLSFKGVEITKQHSAKKASQLRHFAQEYLTFGGFPESLFIIKELHAPLLQDYMNSVIFRDIVHRHKLKNSHMVKRFLLFCLSQPSALLSVTKVFNTFKSQGEAVGKNSLFEYLSYFEDAYALFAVPIFNFSERVRQANPKKIYFVDPGLVTAYSVKPNFEKAACLENSVFMALRRGSKEIFYYRTKSQKEVDFVVMSSKGEISLFQACYSMSDDQTRAREISALKEAANELNLNNGTIITLDYEKSLSEDGIEICCIPFWKWAMIY